MMSTIIPEIRWDLVSDSAVDLTTELSAARMHLEAGRHRKAHKTSSAILDRTAGSTSAPYRAIRASAAAIRAQAARHTGVLDFDADVATAVEGFRGLLDEGYEIGPAERGDFIGALVLSGHEDQACGLVLQWLRVGIEVPSPLVLELAGGASPEIAVDLLSSAKRQKPSDVDVVVSLAVALDRVGDVDTWGAAEIGQAHQDAGLLLARRAKYADAEHHFRKCLELDPRSFVSTAGLVQVLLSQGRVTDAENELVHSRFGGRDSVGSVALWSVVTGEAKGTDAALEIAEDGLRRLGPDLLLMDLAIRLNLLTGRVERAAALIEDALTIDPDDPVILNSKAETLLRTDNPSGAIELVKPMVLAFPDDLNLRITLVKALREAALFLEAAEALTEAMLRFPDDTGLAELRGELESAIVKFSDKHLMDSDTAVVHRAIDALLAVRPASRDGRAWMGEILRREKNYTAALEHLDFALELDPGSSWIIGTRAQVFAALGEAERAIEEFRRAADIDKTAVWIQVELADALRVRGSKKEALAVAIGATQLGKKDDAWAWAVRGSIEQLMERWEDARLSLDTSLGIEPDYAWARGVKANLLDDIGEMEEALEQADRALKLDPTMSWVWTMRAWLLNQLGRDAAVCEEAAAEAIDHDHDSSVAVMLLGDALERQGRDREAELEYGRSIQMASSTGQLDADDLENISWCYLRMRDQDNAMSNITRALSMDFRSVTAQLTAALILLCQERTPLALEEYDRAIARIMEIGHDGRRHRLMLGARRDLEDITQQGQVSDRETLLKVRSMLSEVSLV